MATTALYSPARIGDWGAPLAAPGGLYGEDTFTQADGVRIFYRYWNTANPQAPTLILLHGLGAHTGWFIDVGNSLNALGLNVYMDDHRSFGRSEGPRGHIRDGSIYISDTTRFIQEVQRLRPGSPLTLLGHSMGGIFALYAAAQDATTQRNHLHGLILMNPWIEDTVKLAPSTLISSIAKGLIGSSSIVPLKPNIPGMTLSPEATRLLEADTYWVRNQSAAFLFQISRLRLAVLNQARRVRIPALVIQCDGDTTVSKLASRRCYDALASADKTWKTYPSFAHDYEFEPERAILDTDLARWLHDHGA